MEIIYTSSKQASGIFNLGGSHPVNMKNLFVVRFIKQATNTSNDFTFIAKSVERPSVQPTVEEVNQYNKKRLVQTGLKYNPISCSVYDTADGLAQSMWVEYSKYYFGDYSQTPASYTDDIVADWMLGDGDFGFTIKEPTKSQPQGLNTQYFFNGIEVYHLWGGEFTAYRLINPRITSFNPDELDYEQSAASMIQMTIQYEAIYHENGGKPQSIADGTTTSAAFLRFAFGDLFAGKTANPTGSEASYRKTSFVSVPATQSTSPSTTVSTPKTKAAIKTASTNDSDIGGSISRYGSYDFGDPSKLSEIPITTNSQDLSRSILKTDYSKVPDIGNAVASQPQEDFSNIPDVPLNTGNTIMAYPSEVTDILPSPVPNDALIVEGKNARDRVRLSSFVLAAVNNQSDGTSQIGYRSSVERKARLVREPTRVSSVISNVIFGGINGRVDVISDISDGLPPDNPE